MARQIDVDGWDGEPPKLSELAPATPEVREAIVEMLVFDPNRIQRIVCLADADAWIKQELDGKGVARVTSDDPRSAKLTIYVPKLDPVTRGLLEEDLDNISAIMLTVEIETGWFKYYWQRICRWAHGR